MFYLALEIKYVDSSILPLLDKEVRKMHLEDFKIEEVMKMHLHANKLFCK